MFLYNPEIEMNLNLAAKSESIEKCDLAMIQALKKVEIDVKHDGKDYHTSLTLFFNPENEFINNHSLTRTIKIPCVSVDDAQVEIECSVLDPKPALKKLLEPSVEDNEDEAEIAAKDNISTKPFVCQFTEKSYPIMNEFVSSMKSIYSDPIGHLK